MLFFAQVRELVGTSALEMPDSFPYMATLRSALALDAGKLLAAVNQTLVPMTHPLQVGDDVAFFPSMTGG
ncbi:Sulfur carrier protein MoaD|nr:Sulfur carrier protein MoaD [Candidatus Pantoea persica]